jgi:hypothetical protein
MPRLPLPRSWTFLLIAGLMAVGACSAREERSGPLSRGGSPGADCAAAAVSPIAAGPGAPGPHAVERQEIPHPRSDEPVTVFLPKDAPGRRPVIFFSHGYGPNLWSLYEPLLNHMASQGNVVVFGVFPLGRVTMKERYTILWEGFELAARRLGDRIDLARVGFVGHSFGGGANPTMAFQGIVDQGWGRDGAFLLELAPWYTYGMTDERFGRFPGHVLHAVQVYDQDHMNDHQMAWDLHRQFRTRVNWILRVRSDTAKGCTMAAEHMMPGRAGNPRLLAYGLLRPLDVMMQAAFHRGDPGALAAAMKPSPEGYQPLELLARPPAVADRASYRFAWDGKMNARKPGAEGVRAQFEDLADGTELSTTAEPAPTPERKGLLDRWRERRDARTP